MCISRLIMIAAAGGASLVLAPRAAHAHLDVRPSVEGGRIVTNGFDDPISEFVPGVRVFGYDFQEDPNDPFFINDPGFNAVNGSGLPGGSLGFDLLSGLSYWDGSGEPSLGAPSSSESLKISRGSSAANSRLVTGGGGAQTGFAIGTVSAAGAIHVHVDSFLNGSDGNAIPADPYGDPAQPGDGIEAADGIYVFSLQLTHSDGSVLPSEEFFLVYNNGLSEAVHDEAIEFVQATMVPEPSGLAWVGLVGSSVLGRRGRRR